MLIHCTGQVTTEDASGDGGAHGLGGQALGLAAGADALWGKPMPSFTNGEMQRIVADLLSSRQKQYATLRGDEHEVWLPRQSKDTLHVPQSCSCSCKLTACSHAQAHAIIRS